MAGVKHFEAGRRGRVEESSRIAASRHPHYDATPTPSSSSAPAVVIAAPVTQKSLFDAYLLCIPLGFLGLHHFYLKRYGFGVLYLLTGGLCGIGWIADLVRLPWLVHDANRMLMNPTGDDFRPLSVVDAYLLWFPLGILGFHHFYLRRPIWGVAYLLTGGLFGIGWLVDAFRMPGLVRGANARLEMERKHGYICHGQVNLCETYALCLIPPLGIFGAHHLHMKRYGNAVFYFFTLGGCGFGWMVDWFRLKWLVERTNHPERYLLGSKQKFVDDAYVYGFPLGLLGCHHFYLDRPIWGLLYFFTGGLLSIGWLIDLFRMPCLVRDANRKLENDQALMAVINAEIQTARPYLDAGQGIIVCTPAIPSNPSIGPVAVERGNGIQPTYPPHPPHHHPPAYETVPAPGDGSSWILVPSEAQHQEQPQQQVGPSSAYAAASALPPAYSACDNSSCHGYQRN